MVSRRLALMALCASLAVASCAAANPSTGKFTAWEMVKSALSPAPPAQRDPVPMRLIGAGLSRTGTLSLKTALNELGYQVDEMPLDAPVPCAHQLPLTVPIPARADLPHGGSHCRGLRAPVEKLRGRRVTQRQGASAFSLGLDDYSHVGMLVLRYKPANFEAEEKTELP